MNFKFGASANAASASASSGGGGGLYAGIALSGKPPPAAAPPTKPDHSPSGPEAALDTLPPAQALPAQQDGRPDPGAKADSRKEEEKSKATASSWSSSLRFAPVIRKQAPKLAPKPLAVPFSNSGAAKTGVSAAAFASEEDVDPPDSQPAGRAIHIPGRAKAALTAPSAVPSSKAPSVFARKGGFLAAHAPERIPGAPSAVTAPATAASSGQLSLSEKVDSSIPGFQHSLPAILAQTTTLKGLVPTLKDHSAKTLRKKLEQPPPLTLPDEELRTGGGGDVNGFAQSEIGRKLALRAARNSKKSKKKGKAREVDPAILFMEDYDPARPNDYNEWMNFVKRRREMRREAIRQERERQRRAEREEVSESSAYTSDEESASDDGAPRGNFFPPPLEYQEPANRVGVAAPPATTEASALPISRNETGDEAYARRVALSQGIPYKPSHPGATAEFYSGTHPDLAPVGPTTSIAAASLPTSGPAAIEGGPPEYAQSANTSTVMGSVAPQSVPPVNPTTTLLEAQAKAKLIVAKLAALNKPGEGTVAATAPEPGLNLVPHQEGGGQPGGVSSTSEPPNNAPGQPDFARRFMDKYGWKEGQGLGASESGRTSILTVVPSGPVAGAKKRKDPAVVAVGPMPPSKVGAMGKGRGVVVDEAKTQRELEEKERFGEPTRVVYLTNVVAVNEVDDELAMEIAEEARKHGIVERCFVRVVHRPVEDPSEAVRVFIVYSGLVGAWKAVKTFDGRFFGGRNIRARFFSENSFTLGEWDA